MVKSSNHNLINLKLIYDWTKLFQICSACRTKVELSKFELTNYRMIGWHVSFITKDATKFLHHLLLFIGILEILFAEISILLLYKILLYLLYLNF